MLLPPGLSFNAASAKALAANKSSTLQRSYWDWADMMGPNKTGYFPYTRATNLLYGLNEAIDMLHEEGLDNVFPARPDMGPQPVLLCAAGASRCSAPVKGRKVGF